MRARQVLGLPQPRNQAQAVGQAEEHRGGTGHNADAVSEEATAAIPAEKDSAVISPANPADRDRALVTSSGSTTMASDTEPNTIGLAGATASQNRRVRTAAGGQRREPAVPGRTGVPSGVRASATTAATPISR